MNTSGFAIRTVASITLLLACTALVGGAAEDAQSEREKELQIRAAFLLNFVRFTTWPDETFTSAESPIILTIVGTDPFGRVLEQTFGRERVHGRRVEIRRIAVPNRADFRRDEDYEKAITHMRDRIRPSQVVYITTCDRPRLNLVFKEVDVSRMLTVGFQRQCSERFAALALDVDQGRVVFYANMAVIESSKLRVSSRILALARMVETKDAADEGEHS